MDCAFPPAIICGCTENAIGPEILPPSIRNRATDSDSADGWIITPTKRSTRCTISRSEEHTSELQSHSDLVCRLLLEKKNDMMFFFSQATVKGTLHNITQSSLKLTRGR